MPQSRLMSLVEAVINVVVGYGVAVFVQVLLLPAFGLTLTLRQHLVIGLVFTGVSIVRSFLLRRVFEGLRRSRPQGLIDAAPRQACPMDKSTAPGCGGGSAARPSPVFLPDSCNRTKKDLAPSNSNGSTCFISN